MNKNLLQQRGLTLIEVLIAFTILSFISLSIYQLINGSYRLREDLRYESEFYSSIRLTMAILERDLTTAFSPTLLLPPQPTPNPTDPLGGLFQPTPGSKFSFFRNQNQWSELNQYLQGGADRSSKYWGTVVHPAGVRPGQMVGTETELFFVAATNTRVYKEKKESVFSKVHLNVEKDSLPEHDLQDTQVLVKRINLNVFSMERDEDRDTRSYPLLKGIKKWKFSYYRRDKKQWVNAWNSDSLEQKDTLPDAVMIELEVKGPEQLSFEGSYQFRLEVPYEGLTSTY